MYILPNKNPINMDKLEKAFLDLDLKNIYYLHAETGEVIDNTQILREEKEKYFVVPKLSEETMISWMKEFAEEMVPFDAPELGEKLLIELKKENPIKRFMDKLTVDKSGWIHGWPQWEVDHVFEEIIDWFSSLPIDIEDDMSELDDDCPLCRIMKEGVTDEETIKKGFQELKAKQMVDCMFEKINDKEE